MRSSPHPCNFLPHQSGSGGRLRLLGVEHGLFCSLVTSPSFGDTDTTTVCDAWLWEVKRFHPKTGPWLSPGAESLQPAGGQGPSTPLRFKLQLQNQAAGRPAGHTLAQAGASAVPSTPAGRSSPGHSGCTAGTRTPPPSPPRGLGGWLAGCELTAGRARNTRPGHQGGPRPASAAGLVPGHPAPGAGTPPPGGRRPRPGPAASPRLPDAHVLGDSPL